MALKIIKLAVSDDRVLIFSDTHLSHRFDPAQFKFLKEAIESVDQVIINGDFWDKYETTFDQFINSKWQQLFILLKKKNAIYIYGNHDFKDFSDEQTAVFSDQQGDECWVKTGDYLLKINHGHQVVPSWEIKYPRIFQHRSMLRLGSRLMTAGVKLAKEKFLSVTFVDKNFHAKRWSRQLEENEILVCGHTHVAEYNPDKKYINTGVIRWGLGQYLLIENGQLDLIRSRYR